MDGPLAQAPTAHALNEARRLTVARAIAAAADDGVFDRNEPDCTSDDEDRAYWLRLADAALAADANARCPAYTDGHHDSGCETCDGWPADR